MKASEIRAFARQYRGFKPKMIAEGMGLYFNEVMKALPIWLSARGPIYIHDMSNGHVLATINFLKRSNRESTPDYENLWREAKERGLKIDHNILCPSCSHAVYERDLDLIEKDYFEATDKFNIKRTVCLTTMLAAAITAYKAVMP